MEDTFIYNPNQSVKNQTDKNFYCLSSDADFVDAENNGRHRLQKNTTLALIQTKDGKSFYQIKISSSNQLFNPFSKFDSEKSYSFLDNVVRPTDKFINVNRMVFDYYLKFLQTKNIIWLNKAERERI